MMMTSRRKREALLVVDGREMQNERQDARRGRERV